ncbi:hypothetical protein ACH4UT_32535 [Streptomyces sp. NPDC020799]|uniref:hypothetical protein n=1 Tax=unclassified Streptomyces TaxID=2593676 RepID=UPI003404C86C
MSSTQHIDPSEDDTLPQLTGTWSLVLGTLAATAIGCPLLPDAVPNQFRYLPICVTLPLGLWAVLSGSIALRRMRGDQAAGRHRARAGITLGTVAVVTAAAAIVFACWTLRHAYA